MKLHAVILLCFFAEFLLVTEAYKDGNSTDIQQRINKLKLKIDPVSKQISQLNTKIDAKKLELTTEYQDLATEVQTEIDKVVNFTNQYCINTDTTRKHYNYSKALDTGIKSKPLNQANETIHSFDELKVKVAACNKLNASEECIKELEEPLKSVESEWAKVNISQMNDIVEHFDDVIEDSAKPVTEKIKEQANDAKSCFENLNIAKSKIDAIKGADIIKSMGEIDTAVEQTKNKLDIIIEGFGKDISNIIGTKNKQIEAVEDQAKKSNVNVKSCDDKVPNFNELKETALRHLNQKIEQQRQDIISNANKSIESVKNYQSNAYEKLRSCKQIECMEGIAKEISVEKITFMKNECLKLISKSIENAHTTENTAENETSKDIEERTEGAVSCIQAAISKSNKEKIKNNVQKLMEVINAIVTSIDKIENNTSSDFQTYKEHNISVVMAEYKSVSEVIKKKEKSFEKFPHLYCHDLEDDFTYQGECLPNILKAYDGSYKGILESIRSEVNKRKLQLSDIMEDLEKCEDGDAACLSKITEKIDEYNKDTDFTAMIDIVKQNITQANITMIYTVNELASAMKLKGEAARHCLSNLSDLRNNIVDNCAIVGKKIGKTNASLFTQLDEFSSVAEAMSANLSATLKLTASSSNDQIQSIIEDVKRVYGIITQFAQIESAKQQTDSLKEFDVFVNNTKTNIASAVQTTMSSIKNATDKLEDMTLGKLSTCKDGDCLKNVDIEYKDTYNTITTNITSESDYLTGMITSERGKLDILKTNISESFSTLFESSIKCLITLKCTAAKVEEVDNRLNDAIASALKELRHLENENLESITRENSTFTKEIEQKWTTAMKDIADKRKGVNSELIDSCSKKMDAFEKTITNDVSKFNASLNNMTTNINVIIGKSLNSIDALYPSTKKTFEKLGNCVDEQCISTIGENSRSGSEKNIETTNSKKESASLEVADFMKKEAPSDMRQKCQKATIGDMDRTKETVLNCLNSSKVFTPSLGLLVILLVTHLSKFIYE